MSPDAGRLPQAASALTLALTEDVGRTPADASAAFVAAEDAEPVPGGGPALEDPGTVQPPEGDGAGDERARTVRPCHTDGQISPTVRLGNMR